MYECKIAENLIKLRTAKGATQEDVAQSLSVSNKTISKWENGTSTPDLNMLIELSRYYGVTSDALLGLSEEKKQSTVQEVCSMLFELDRPNAVLKAFETVRALVPGIYGKIPRNCVRDDAAVPEGLSQGCRSQIKTDDLFEFTVSSENVNAAVMLLRNKADFAWMNDPCCQKEIVRVFKSLSSADALTVLYYINSAKCSDCFTADHIAKNTGVEEERTAELLDEFCSLGVCRCVTAQLTEGEVRVYECSGDGLFLALISLAYERMCGMQSYDYNYNGICKMIGGK